MDAVPGASNRFADQNITVITVIILCIWCRLLDWLTDNCRMSRWLKLEWTIVWIPKWKFKQKNPRKISGANLFPSIFKTGTKVIKINLCKLYSPRCPTINILKLIYSSNQCFNETLLPSFQVSFSSTVVYLYLFCFYFRKGTRSRCGNHSHLHRRKVIVFSWTSVQRMAQSYFRRDALEKTDRIKGKIRFSMERSCSSPGLVSFTCCL